MEPEHSKLPWRLEFKNDEDKILIMDAEGGKYPVTEIVNDGCDCEPNARLIVHAVNLHQELTTALKALVDMAKKGQEPSAERIGDYQALIAKAEER